MNHDYVYVLALSTDQETIAIETVHATRYGALCAAEVLRKDYVGNTYQGERVTANRLDWLEFQPGSQLAKLNIKTDVVILRQEMNP